MDSLRIRSPAIKRCLTTMADVFTNGMSKPAPTFIAIAARTDILPAAQYIYSKCVAKRVITNRFEKVVEWILDEDGALQRELYRFRTRTLTCLMLTSSMDYSHAYADHGATLGSGRWHVMRRVDLRCRSRRDLTSNDALQEKTNWKIDDHTTIRRR